MSPLSGIHTGNIFCETNHTSDSLCTFWTCFGYRHFSICAVSSKVANVNAVTQLADCDLMLIGYIWCFVKHIIAIFKVLYIINK